jgi:hypothetical protein
LKKIIGIFNEKKSQPNIGKLVKKHIKKMIQHDHVSLIPRMKEWLNILISSNVMQHINRSNDKNEMILSIDVENSFDHIQHTFTIKH